MWRWVHQSRSGHRKRKQHLKLAFLNMALASGVLFSPIPTLPLFSTLALTSISRKKAKLALKRALPPPKHDHDGNNNNNNNTRALTIVPLANEEERTNPTSPRTHASKKSITSLDKIILEAITNLKKPRGSDRTSMFMVYRGQLQDSTEYEKTCGCKTKASII